MNTLWSWAVFLALFGGLAWHYSGRPNFFAKAFPQKPPTLKQSSASNAASRKTKTKGKPVEGKNIPAKVSPVVLGESKEANASRKRKIAAPQAASSEKATGSASSEKAHSHDHASEARSDVDQNAAFAREMAITRAGTQFSSSDKPSSRMKKARPIQNEGSIHLSNGTDSPALSAAVSSTTGDDGDDDLPIETPVAGGVSDMLEKTGPGPSVLRLTDVDDHSSKAGPKRPSKAFEPAETKKQRQRRAKQEAHKALAAEEERDRRKRMEQQIRGARMADGTSAQLRTDNFKPPTTNAWAPKPNQSQESTGTPDPIVPLPLLDTFESEQQPKKNGSNGVRHEPAFHASDSTNNESNPKMTNETGKAPSQAQPAWTHDLPGEEEQMRLLQDNEDHWTTVGKKDKKKVSNTQEPNAVRAQQTSSSKTSQTNGNKPMKAVNTQSSSSSSANIFQQLEDTGLQDSDWAA